MIGINFSAYSQTNILTNPGFETGNTGGWAHWCINSTATGKENHSGVYSVELDELGLSGEYDKGALIQEVTEDFSCGEPLYANVWIKTDGLDADAFLKLEFWNKDGLCLKFIEGRKITGTNDWTKISVSIPSVPVETTMVKLLLQLNHNPDKGNRGKAYFDDVYLDVISSTPPI